MTSILSQLKPVTDARLDELLAKLLDGELILVGSKGETAEDVAACFYELRQLRAAASTPTVESIPLSPGGDERAAARTFPCDGEQRWGDYDWVPVRVLEQIPGGYIVIRRGSIFKTFPRAADIRFPPTHADADSSGPAHAELAPAADPAPPFGSAVGGPGFNPYED